MRIRLMFAAAATASLAVVGAAAPAQARCDQGGPTAGHTEHAEVPVTGSHVYSSGNPGATNGYIGIHGGIGYIEAGGDAGGGNGGIQMATADGTQNATVSGDADAVSACANQNETTIPIP